ncbi:hypothetical protein [Pyrococcus kukulkanii]|uniref:Permease n=1 Tax=Pyrococcus kukulkanii TaxID=1609559 RepID=A0ABV4T929_9EURY
MEGDEKKGINLRYDLDTSFLLFFTAIAVVFGWGSADPILLAAVGALAYFIGFFMGLIPVGGPILTYWLVKKLLVTKIGTSITALVVASVVLSVIGNVVIVLFILAAIARPPWRW